MTPLQNSRIGRIALLMFVVLFPLLMGGAVRRIGILHGAPQYMWHPDVPKQVRVAREHYEGVLDLRSLYKHDVELTMYPYGTAVIGSRVVRVWGKLTGVEWLHRNSWNWAQMMRWLSTGFALVGIGAALLVLYGLLGPFATFLTGLLLALEPMNSQISHYGMNDVPLTAILLVVWLCVSRIPSEPARFPVFSLLAGALLGIGFGIKYQAILGGAMVGTAWLLAWRQKGWRTLLVAVAAFGLGGVAGALITTPMLLESPSYFFENLPVFLSWQANITQLDLPFVPKVLRNVQNLALLAMGHGAGLVAPLAAVGAAGVRDPRLHPRLRIVIASGLAFAAVLSAATVASRDFVRANDALPFVLILIVLAGIGLARCAPPGGFTRDARRLWAPVLAAAAITWFAVTAFQDSLALQRRDTRELAVDWCRRNIPAGSVVRREYYVLPVNKAGLIDREHRYFSEPEVMRILREGHYDYLLTCSFAHDRVFNPLLPYHSEQDQADYAWIREHNEVVAEFTDRDMLYAHPVITIYHRPGGAARVPTP